MPTIRSRVEADITPCVAILEQVHAKEGYPHGSHNFHDFIRGSDDSKAWVAEQEDGQLIGHIAIAPPIAGDLAVSTYRSQRSQDEAIWSMKRLFILPAAQRKGVAVALVERAVECAREMGVRLVLFAMVDQNAIALYRRLGWEEYGSGVRNYDGQEVGAICFASPRIS